MKSSRTYPPNRIRARREERNLSQEALAERIGTSNQQIGRLENQERRLTWEWMQRIAGALECHPMDLVEVEPKPGSDEERKLLETYRLLPPDEKRTITTMADYLAEKTSPGFTAPAPQKPLKK